MSRPNGLKGREKSRAYVFQSYAASGSLFKIMQYALLPSDIKNRDELNSKNCSKAYRGSNLA